MALIATLALLVPRAVTSPARAQATPSQPCDGAAGACELPTVEGRDPFSGDVLTLHTVADEAGDGPLDLLGVSWGETRIDAVRSEALRADRSFVASNNRRRAAQEGLYLYVRLDYAALPGAGAPDSAGVSGTAGASGAGPSAAPAASPPADPAASPSVAPVDPVTGSTSDAGLHLAFDGDARGTNDVPATRANLGSPLPGNQFLLSWFPDSGRALASNFASGGYFEARVPFLALDEGSALHLLIARDRVADSIAPAAFTPGEGWDRLDGVFRGVLPLDGRIEPVVECGRIQVAVADTLVDEVRADGQTFRDLALPVRRTESLCLRLTGADAEALRAALAVAGATTTEDGLRIELPLRVVVESQGMRQDQGGTARLRLAGDRLCVTHDIGLVQLGYHAVESLAFESTGDADADVVLARAAAAMVDALPAGRADRGGGVLLDEGDGHC